MENKFVVPYGIEGEVLFVIENASSQPQSRHTPIVKVGEKYFCERCGIEVPSEQFDWDWEFWLSHPRCEKE